jgi:hypothetical protein
MKIRWNLLMIAGALFANFSAQAVSLDLRPASSSFGLGESVQVELRISGLGDATAPSLGAYDFLLAFNPAVLGFDGFTFGDSILGNQLDLTGFGTVSGFDGGVPGQLNVFEISLDLANDLNALQAGEFALGTISFNTLGNGTSGMQFTSALFSDATGKSVAVQLGSGSVNVPEPVSGGFVVAAAIAFVLGAQHLKRTRAEKDRGWARMSRDHGCRGWAQISRTF